MNHSLVLASGSPRRKELLESLNFEFKTLSPSFKESVPNHLTNGRDIAEHLASSKASQLRVKTVNDVYLTADTIVQIDGVTLGKPKNEKQAIAYLKSLSGKSHQVITGCCLSTSKKQIVFSSVTEVTFNELDEDDIRYYVKKFSPLDKAGAYGIQEWIGLIGISEIKGSYYNVMGLPTEMVYQKIKTEFPTLLKNALQ